MLILQWSNKQNYGKKLLFKHKQIKTVKSLKQTRNHAETTEFFAPKLNFWTNLKPQIWKHIKISKTFLTWAIILRAVLAVFFLVKSTESRRKLSLVQRKNFTKIKIFNAMKTNLKQTSEKPKEPSKINWSFCTINKFCGPIPKFKLKNTKKSQLFFWSKPLFSRQAWS